jgi:tetratricopeptide (TPR) repeat protein
MKKKTFLLINIFFLLSLTSCATSQENSEISLYSNLNEGSSSFDKKDYVKAEEFFSNALLLDEKNEITLKNEILTLNKLERNTDALALAKKALVYYPNSIKFKLIQARLLRTLDLDIDAINIYKEVLGQVDSKESYHKEYIEYLTSLLPSDNILIKSSILNESNFLLKSHMCTEEALIALCTLDKTSLLYSLMLKEKNSDEWKIIYEIEEAKNNTTSNKDDKAFDFLNEQEEISIDKLKKDII